MPILLVEDEHDLADIIGYTLRRSGHEVITAYDGIVALKLVKARKPRLVILDIHIPHIDGWQILQHIRTASTIPVIMLTACDADEEIVRGLRLGADDYVTKPFSPAQLVARVEAVLRRAAPDATGARPRVIEAGDISLDLGMHRVSIRDRDLNLTKIEFRLLYELALRDGEVVSHQELTRRVWGYQDVDGAAMAKSHIRNLRRKIEPDPANPRYLHTVSGIGYRLTGAREPEHSRQPA